MKELAISKTLSVPINVVTQKLAALGISGSGKTYGTGKLVEEMLDAGAQVLIIDTIGNWYGLRLAADGKKPGIAIPILGGQHADVPLEPHHGKLTAETAATSGASMIVDISDFSNEDMRRFVTAFATTFLHLKKSHRSAVHIVWEECQKLVPQQVRGQTAAVVGAVEALIKQGRNYGCGTTLVSQRPAAVNKEVLNQVETIFCFRQNAKHDRKALEDWIVDKSIDVGGMIDELPSLETGQCVVWSPFWLKVLTKIKIGKKWTFDASATPEFGDEQVSAGKLAAVDLDKFKAKMGDAIAKANARDPDMLLRQIAVLVGTSARQAEEIDKLKAKPAKEKRVEVPAVSPAMMARIEKVAAQVEKVGRLLVNVAGDLADGMHQPKPEPAPITYKQALQSFTVTNSELDALARPQKFLNGKGEDSPRGESPDGRSRSTLPGKAPGGVAPGAVSSPAKGERIVLTAIAQCGIGGASREQLTILTGYKRTTRDEYIKRLKAAQLVGELGNGNVAATSGGVNALGPSYKPLPKGRELRDYWLERLPEGERRILEVLVQNYPDSVSRETVGEVVGYKRTTRDEYIKRLKARRLVNGKSEVGASSELFS